MRLSAARQAAADRRFIVLLVAQASSSGPPTPQSAVCRAGRSADRTANRRRPRSVALLQVVSVVAEIHVQHVEDRPGAVEERLQLAQRQRPGRGARAPAGQGLAAILVDHAIVDAMLAAASEDAGDVLRVEAMVMRAISTSSCNRSGRYSPPMKAGCTCRALVARIRSVPTARESRGSRRARPASISR